MKLLKFIILSVLFTGSAHAQFGNFLKELKSAAEAASSQAGTETTQSQNKQQSPATGSAAKGNTQQSSSNQSGLKAVDAGPPAKSDAVAFQCKINGKTLLFGNNLDSDDPNITVRMENVHAKPLVVDYDYDWSTTYKDPLRITEESGNRYTITTVYFMEKQKTYGVSFCEGMLCGNPDQPYFFTVYDGTKKVSQEFCDENTASEFNFPVKMDKNGKLVTQLKEVIVVKKSTLKFNPFN